MNPRKLHLALALLAVFTCAAFAQDPPAAPRKLVVLTKPVKPFVFDRDGVQVGYSIDLWRRIAQEAKIDFEFQPKTTVPEVIDALKKGEADAGIGAFSITAEREAAIDFSHPFYESGLRILVPSEGESSAFSAFAAFLKPDTLKVIGVLILALLVNSYILWWLEHRRNAESFPEQFGAGMVEATWWSICTLITGGCENKAPVGLLGRLAAIIWMLAGIALTAYITATLSAALTVSTLTSDIRTLADLNGKEVGTVTGSAAEKFLSSRGPKLRGYATVEAACEGAARGEVRAVIYDEPLLRYYLASNPGAKLQLVGDIFDQQNYGIALRQSSPQRKAINTALLKLNEEGFFEELNKKWFAAGAP
jgi:ABC-type amino acid transport substrate-binding protein